MEKKNVAKLVGMTATALLSATLLKNRASKSPARGKIVVVGGGTAGITVAARLSRALRACADRRVVNVSMGDETPI